MPSPKTGQDVLILRSSFHFVPFEGTHDDAPRNPSGAHRYSTAIRQHVMRNVGVSRRKRKKTTTNEKNIPNSSDKDQVITCPAPVKDIKLDPFVQWPVNITHRKRYLLDYLLTTDCNSIQTYRWGCWSLIHRDPSILYQTLSISAFCLSARCEPERRKVLESEALLYYTKGLMSVNSRLGTEAHQQDDGVLVGIMGIAVHTLSYSKTGLAAGWCWQTTETSPVKCYRSSESVADDWALHMSAIKIILDARGGIDCLKSNEGLQFLLATMDVEGAAARDVTPFFPVPNQALQSIQTPYDHKSASLQACISSWVESFPEEQAVMDIFMDLAHVMRHFEESRNIYQTLMPCASRVNPLVHRCLQLSGKSVTRGQGVVQKGRDLQHSDRLDSRDYRTALRLSIILFLAPVRRRFGIPVSGSQLQLQEVKPALQVCLAHVNARLHQLLLWMLLVGGMEALSVDDGDWFCERIVTHCAGIGVTDFDDLRETITCMTADLVWLDDLAPELAAVLDRLSHFLPRQCGAE